MPEECLFCDIVSGEQEADVLFENSQVLAFEDINPQAPVHYLVIPKKHIASVNELEAGDEHLVGKLHLAARQLAEEDEFAADGYRLVVNCGDDALQSVDHLHLHVLAGREMDWPPG